MRKKLYLVLSFCEHNLKENLQGAQSGEAKKKNSQGGKD